MCREKGDVKGLSYQRDISLLFRFYTGGAFKGYVIEIGACIEQLAIEGAIPSCDGRWGLEYSLSVTVVYAKAVAGWLAGQLYAIGIVLAIAIG